jgi:hypothetical protein
MRVQAGTSRPARVELTEGVPDGGPGAAQKRRVTLFQATAQLSDKQNQARARFEPTTVSAVEGVP